MMCRMSRYILICLGCLGLSVATDIILSERVPTNGKVSDITKESDTNAEERIVGGRNATCEEYPHQVSFVVNNSYFCGGFIISDQYILTAAHCAQEVDPSTVVMRIGSTWRKNGTKVTVTEVIPYPEYNKPPYDKDIAVMKIDEPLQFDACTQPIALPPKGLSASYGEVMTVSGWGRTKYGASMIPDRLMAVNLTVVNHTLCRAAYLPLTITGNMLCAGNFFLGGQSTCQGDSGGIGAINNIARGIVSFGRGCGQPLAPSVFTDISAPDMRDFITKHTGL